MSSLQKNLTTHLAEQLQHWLWQKFGDKTPAAEEIATFMAAHFDSQGITLSKEGMTEEAKLPALFKSPSASQSRRMRELAGIPHKDNFV